MKSRSLLVFAVLVSVLPLQAQTVEQWISRARNYLGTDSALNNVTSIHFVGTLETTEKVPSEKDKSILVEQPINLPVDIIFQKPHRQRITVTGPKLIEVTALDGYDAWLRRTNPANPTQWQLTLLNVAQIKRLRAESWDNLNFLTGIDKLGGTVRLDGEATVDGVACVKLVVAYLETMVYTRYFDKATARLVKTYAQDGTEIREEGETIVNGIRFSRKVINRSANGHVTTVHIDRVLLNENFPASEFAVPALQTN